MTGKIGVLADIHGNVWALDAVLRDAARRDVSEFLNLGDVFYGPLRPRETFERLRQENVRVTIRGNQDRQIYEACADDIESNATLAFVIEDLGREPVEWLKSLPPTAVFDGDIFLCHGTPSSDEAYLLEDVDSGHPVIRPDSSIRDLLGGIRSPLVLCGHTHIPRLVQLSTGQLIVNPGSVGLPAYSDDLPVKHAMESYSPHASYAILQRDGHGWDLSFYRTAYDYEKAAQQARTRNRQDWARGLATGRSAP